MLEHHWKINDSLGLEAIDEQHLADHRKLVSPEQSIDTILHRNLEILPAAIVGAPGHFLFHSSHYWGAFDVCCTLADRRLVAFENKARRLTKKDFDKFCRDVRTVKSEGREYVEKRYLHTLQYFSTYMTLAERMYAAFFLGIRCDTERDSRDLTSEACALLAIDKDQFLTRFQSRNQWLDLLRSSPAMDDYLSVFSGGINFQAFTPVLLTPDIDIHIIHDWCKNITSPTGVTAHLATYDFAVRDLSYPESLSVRYIGTFNV